MTHIRMKMKTRRMRLNRMSSMAIMQMAYKTEMKNDSFEYVRICTNKMASK